MQTRTQSLFESIINIAVGLLVSMLANTIMLPLVFGVAVSLHQNAVLAVIYTLISLVRSYCLRRYFNRRHGYGPVIGSKLEG